MRLPPIYPKDPLPIYAQLERGIRMMVHSGELKAGEQLPTVRQLAVDLRINANTVAKVYAELERAGVVESRRGVGTFVRSGSSAVPVERTAILQQLAEPLLTELHRHGLTANDLIEYLRTITQNP